MFLAQSVCNSLSWFHMTALRKTPLYNAASQISTHVQIIQNSHWNADSVLVTWEKLLVVVVSSMSPWTPFNIDTNWRKHTCVIWCPWNYWFYSLYIFFSPIPSTRSISRFCFVVFFFALSRSKVKLKTLVIQSYLTLCDPMDYSPPGPCAHGISQAIILEWVSMPYTPGDLPNSGSKSALRIAGRFFTIWTTREAHA